MSIQFAKRLIGVWSTLLLLAQLAACVSYEAPPAVALDRGLQNAAPPDLKDLPSSHSLQIERFYASNVSTHVVPYINTIRSLDGIPQDQECTTTYKQKLGQALSLNPTSLYARALLFACAAEEHNSKEVDVLLGEIHALSEALISNESGDSFEGAIEIRELDEAHILLQFYGFSIIDVEMVTQHNQFAYKFHVYNREYERASYKYFHNSRLLKIIYESGLNTRLSEKDITAISLDTYTEDKSPPVLIHNAKKQLENKCYSDVIQTLKPIIGFSDIAAVLTAEAALQSGLPETFENLRKRLDLASQAGLLDAKVLLAYVSYEQAKSDSDLRDAFAIMQEIDLLTWPGNGAYLLANKFDVYDQKAIAISLYKEAAHLGSDDAQVILGELYDSGANGLIQNSNIAFKLYQQSAQSNNLEATYRLGVWFGENKDPASRDYLKAKNYLELAADRGHANAFANLGYMYESGRGVKKNNEVALNYYKKAVKKNSAMGLNNLANFYFYGTVVDQNIAKAIELYKRAAELNDDRAMVNLGKIYRDGIGVPVDFSKAFALFEKAALVGFKQAMIELADMYANGFGTDKNEQKAQEWQYKAQH